MLPKPIMYAEASLAKKALTKKKKKTHKKHFKNLRVLSFFLHAATTVVFGREGGDIGLFITLVPKVLQ